MGEERRAMAGRRTSRGKFVFCWTWWVGGWLVENWMKQEITINDTYMPTSTALWELQTYAWAPVTEQQMEGGAFSLSTARISSGPHPCSVFHGVQFHFSVLILLEVRRKVTQRTINLKAAHVFIASKSPLTMSVSTAVLLGH
jgi:hypothetical protein